MPTANYLLVVALVLALAFALAFVLVVFAGLLDIALFTILLTVLAVLPAVLLTVLAVLPTVLLTVLAVFLTLLTALFIEFPVSPEQAAPKIPNVKAAESAIAFFIFNVISYLQNNNKIIC